MRGRGQAQGGITFVNALFTGTGSAAGIDLATTAEVVIEPAVSPRIAFDGSPESPLARAVAGAALRKWAPAGEYDLRVRLTSDVPPSCGLKSSSAVAGAVTRAIASAFGRSPAPDDLAALGARVAREIGQSATGAFDDALAAVEPGIHVTDNAAYRRLRTDPPDPAWRVTLLLPPGQHPPSPTVHEAFRRYGDDAARAVNAALDGAPLAALELNSPLVEAVLGYDLGSLRARAHARGAIAVGVSGLGPAVAAIVPRDHTGPSVFAGEDGQIRECQFSSLDARGREQA